MTNAKRKKPRPAPGKLAQEGVMRAAKVWATAYLKYGKELESEEEKLVRAAKRAWPQLRKLE
jgi:hypothetical protein